MSKPMLKFCGVVVATTLLLAFGAAIVVGADQMLWGVAFEFRPLVLMCFLLAVLAGAMAGLPSSLKDSFLRGALVAALLLLALAPLLTVATMRAEPEYGYLVNLVSLLGLGVFVVPVAVLVMQFGAMAAGWIKQD